MATGLIYQLKERMVFVKPKDAVVANLLFSLSVIESHTDVVEEAIPLTKMAVEYGFRDNGLVAGKMALYQRARFLGKLRSAGPFVLVGLALVAFAVFACKKKWLFLSRSAYRKHLEEKANAKVAASAAFMR